MKTLIRKSNYKNINILLLIFIAIFIFLPQKAQAYEYAAPAWMDNEHIICVKYVPTTKKRLIPFLGDLSDARYILTKQEIQLVSMDINGNNEKIIKSIVIDYPGMSPKWQEEIFKGVLRVRMLAYCPQKKLIAFCTHGDVKSVFMINSDGTGAKRIADIGGGMYFSPDGKYMEYTSKYKVWLYDLDTAEQKVLIEDAVSGPWSPDGKKIAIVRDLNKENNIYIYDLETSAEEKTEKKGLPVAWLPETGFIFETSSLQMNYPRISPDGTRLVGEPYSYPETRIHNNIGISDLKGKNLRVLRYEKTT